MLPITEFLPQVIAHLGEHNNLVLQAEPGAGKSTALPLSLLEHLRLGGKKILMLEPRRVAVKSIANYLAKQLGEKVGQTVGYQIKNERRVSKETVLEVVTEGILTRRLQQDPEISDVALIIFDEFHERSIHSDLSLQLALEIQQALREDLKILLMSATIDTQSLSKYLGDCAVISCPGRAHPVELLYQPSQNERDPLNTQVLRALKTLLAQGQRGDILVFLPGQGEINRSIALAKQLQASKQDLLCVPLFGGLALAAQEKALLPDPEGRQKIIFATNIAETSLTIEGITCVIDSGLERNMKYDANSGMSRLETSYISKASAEQRKGRAGRTQAGLCTRLWSEAKQQSLSDYQEEEITTADLSGFLLELYTWGSTDYDKINWLTPPPKAHFLSAQQTLSSLGFINEALQLREAGKQAAKLPLAPRLAAMLLACNTDIERTLACDLAALLSERDILTQHRGVDIGFRLQILQDYRNNRSKALQEYNLHRATIENLLTSSKALAQELRRLLTKEKRDISKENVALSLSDIQQSIGKVLLHAFPDRLAKKRASDDGRYLLAKGKGVFLFEDDRLFNSEWLIVANCDAQKKEGRIYSAASIEKKTVLECLGAQIIKEQRFEIDRKSQKVVGKQISRIGEIIVDSKNLQEIPPEQFNDCLAQLISKEGLSVLNWTQACEAWLARAEWLGSKLESFPSLSKPELIASIDTWLLPYLSHINSMGKLKKLNILELLQGCLSWEEQNLLKKEAPVEYLTPSNKAVPIRYESDQGPSVSVVLQEVFGELASPKLAAGKVALRFELLSPARRPIQTTSDLENFWRSSYFEVIKDMKGRYPKHRWPDKPLLEKAGRSIKRKT